MQGNRQEPVANIWRQLAFVRVEDKSKDSMVTSMTISHGCDFVQVCFLPTISEEKSVIPRSRVRESVLSSGIKWALRNGTLNAFTRLSRSISSTVNFSMFLESRLDGLTIAGAEGKNRINFAAIGAGVAGLSCAVALRRIGHTVTEVEQKHNMSDSEHQRGVRMPPNLTKVLIHWGLKEQLDAISVKSEAIHILLGNTGELLGTQHWDEELYGKLGENTFSPCGYTRKCMEFIDLFSSATILKAALLRNPDPDVKHLYAEQHTTLFCWLGHGRSAVGHPVGGTTKFALCAYGPYDDKKSLPVDGIRRNLDGTEPSGRLVIVGTTAHPIPPGSIQESAMSVEDGAILARLFSHLRADKQREQINLFLWAF
ncbi:hypothetical protein B0H19DRAFT_1062632 [Mycena capillaripes]|nr:hypothetical protein B0H19DRAFT_1062632 [Mycena capillaripes]